jgi:hypothetical protein
LLGDVVAGNAQIGWIPVLANTAAGIVAELVFEPPVYSFAISTTDGSVWQHISAGVTASTWTNDFPGLPGLTVSATELNQLATGGAVLADFVKLHALTATAAQLNQLANLGTGISSVMGFGVTLTHAQTVAGGQVLIPAVASKIIRIKNLQCVSIAALTTTATTSLTLVDTNGSPVTAATIAKSALTGSNALAVPTFTAAGITGLTSGAGLTTLAIADVTSSVDSTFIGGTFSYV